MLFHSAFGTRLAKDAHDSQPYRITWNHLLPYHRDPDLMTVLPPIVTPLPRHICPEPCCQSGQAFHKRFGWLDVLCQRHVRTEHAVVPNRNRRHAQSASQNSHRSSPMRMDSVVHIDRLPKSSRLVDTSNARLPSKSSKSKRLYCCANFPLIDKRPSVDGIYKFLWACVLCGFQNLDTLYSQLSNWITWSKIILFDDVSL